MYIYIIPLAVNFFYCKKLKTESHQKSMTRIQENICIDTQK